MLWRSELCFVVVGGSDYLNTTGHAFIGKNDSVRANLIANLANGLAHIRSKESLYLHYVRPALALLS